MINVSEFLPVVESLRTRIAEDEAAALAGAGDPTYPHYGATAAEESVYMAEQEGCAEDGVEHLRRWLPRRVLDDCAIRRRVLDQLVHQLQQATPLGNDDDWQIGYTEGLRDATLAMLTILAGSGHTSTSSESSGR